MTEQAKMNVSLSEAALAGKLTVLLKGPPAEDGTQQVTSRPAGPTDLVGWLNDLQALLDQLSGRAQVAAQLEPMIRRIGEYLQKAHKDTLVGPSVADAVLAIFNTLDRTKTWPTVEEVQKTVDPKSARIAELEAQLAQQVATPEEAQPEPEVVGAIPTTVPTE